MSKQKFSSKLRQDGFTLVELLIVIVVIAILAVITIVTYTNVSKRAAVASLQSDLSQVANQLNTAKVDSGSYPLTSSITPNTYFKHSNGTNLEYTSTDGSAFCITASSSQAQDNYYFDSTVGKVAQGKCPGHIGYAGGSTLVIQTVTSANCPASITMATDARDNHTYWVQKLADGKCWMLTNLAYAGGGANTYGDTKTLVNGVGQPTTYTTASYYTPTSGANVTSAPTTPSTSTDGGATNPQYGYLYNLCGALGGQATSACSSSSTPTINSTISICPAGWRLPTGNGGEIGALNNAVNGGASNTDAGLRNSWLSQRGGQWDSAGFTNQNIYSIYWTSTQNINSSWGYNFAFTSSSVSLINGSYKYQAFAVRCLAN